MRHRIWPISHLPSHLLCYSVLCTYILWVYPQEFTHKKVTWIMLYPWCYDSTWIIADAQKSIYWALVDVAQLINWLNTIQCTKRLQYQSLVRAPAQGPGCGFNPQSRCVQEATNQCFSHGCFSLSPSSPPLSL